MSEMRALLPAMMEARDRFMETVDEQEGDRTIPFDLERSLGNGFDEVPDTGIRNIVQESLARRRHLLHPLV